MKNLFLAFGLMLSGSAFSLPHLDLEMTSDEYRAYLSKLPADKNLTADEPEIAASLKLGDRLSKWIAKINSSRPAGSAIRLTSPQTRTPIPIDKPKIYSPSIIGAEAKKVLAELPEAMRSVIISTAELPATTGLSDETFIKHARLLDKNYQSAARYKSVNPYRFYYTQAAAKDVRGFYYLIQNKLDAEALREASRLEPSKLPFIKEALVRVCLNAGMESPRFCEQRIDRAFMENTIATFYEQYISTAEQNWNSFFLIPASAVRTDTQWTETLFTIPFNTPSIARFIPYLKNNIEDEFRFGNWKLRLNFGTFGNGPRLVFQPGVVPHVNGLGGNEIVMDSNQPIEEYESQWTIRHEFGHVLGLPDCYHEFFDTSLRAYVNYQLDVTDLMCSRAGNMKERIYTELKKAYGN